MGNDEIDAARKQVITAMERSAAEYGLPRSCGRMYGILYLAEQPLSLDDLVDVSGYAKSTVSDITRTLEDLYLVRQTSPPSGGRRSYFEAERDLWYAFQKVAQESGRREVALMRRALKEAETTLEDADDAETDLQRVRDLKATYDQASILIDILDELSPDELFDALVQVADDAAVSTEYKRSGLDTSSPE